MHFSTRDIVFDGLVDIIIHFKQLTFQTVRLGEFSITKFVYNIQCLQQIPRISINPLKVTLREGKLASLLPHQSPGLQVILLFIWAVSQKIELVAAMGLLLGIGFEVPLIGFVQAQMHTVALLIDQAQKELGFFAPPLSLVLYLDQELLDKLFEVLFRVFAVYEVIEFGVNLADVFVAKIHLTSRNSVTLLRSLQLAANLLDVGSVNVVSCEHPTNQFPIFLRSNQTQKLRTWKIDHFCRYLFALKEIPDPFSSEQLQVNNAQSPYIDCYAILPLENFRGHVERSSDGARCIRHLDYLRDTEVSNFRGFSIKQYIFGFDVAMHDPLLEVQETKPGRNSRHDLNCLAGLQVTDLPVQTSIFAVVCDDDEIGFLLKVKELSSPQNIVVLHGSQCDSLLSYLFFALLLDSDHLEGELFLKGPLREVDLRKGTLSQKPDDLILVNGLRLRDLHNYQFMLYPPNKTLAL